MQGVCGSGSKALRVFVAAAVPRVVVDKGSIIGSSAVVLEEIVVEGGALVKDERAVRGNDHEELFHVEA